eukprot:1144498-Rhodomonas_salina.1
MSVRPQWAPPGLQSARHERQIRWRGAHRHHHHPPPRQRRTARVPCRTACGSCIRLGAWMRSQDGRSSP